MSSPDKIPSARLESIVQMAMDDARRDTYAKLQRVTHRGMSSQDLVAVWGPNHEEDPTESGLMLWHFHPSDFHLIAVLRNGICLDLLWEYVPEPGSPSLDDLHREFLVFERWSELAVEARAVGMKATLEMTRGGLDA